MDMCISFDGSTRQGDAFAIVARFLNDAGLVDQAVLVALERSSQVGCWLNLRSCVIDFPIDSHHV